MRQTIGAIVSIILLHFVIGCDSKDASSESNPEVSSENRPSSWAQPIELEGVPNLHKVSDNLYRSAQPTEQGMKNLKKLGIETVVNLRSFNSDRDDLENTGIGYEHIYMKAWHPEEKEVVRFLQIVTNEKRTPVLVHCQHGADRTGTMSAIYRIAVQGWKEEEATREMTEGGFGFHDIWTNLPKWIQKLDIKSIQKKEGVAAPETEQGDDGCAGKPVTKDLYDKSLDGSKQIADALRLADKGKKRVLLQLGANWCPWCHALHHLFETDEEIKKTLEANYVLVMIDTDKEDNEKIDKKYEYPTRFGLPVIVVLDSKGKQLTTKNVEEMEKGSRHDRDKVLAFLKKWSP